jgi:hypothetical protein
VPFLSRLIALAENLSPRHLENTRNTDTSRIHDASQLLRFAASSTTGLSLFLRPQRRHSSSVLPGALSQPPRPLQFMLAACGGRMAARRALGWAGSCALPVPFGGRAASTGSERARARLRQALETEGSPQTLRDFIPTASSSLSAPFAAGAGTDEAPYSVSAPKKEGRQPKPEWLKRSVPGGENYMHIKYAHHSAALRIIVCAPRTATWDVICSANALACAPGDAQKQAPWLGAVYRVRGGKVPQHW